MAETRTCPACGGALPHGRLLCKGCWFVVPRKLRGDVNRSWRAFNVAEGADARLAALANYRSVADAATAVAKGALP